MECTIYVFETDKTALYVDYDDNPDIRRPYELHRDEKFICRRETLSEVLIVALIAAGPGRYYKKEKIKPETPKWVKEFDEG